MQWCKQADLERAGREEAERQRDAARSQVVKAVWDAMSEGAKEAVKDDAESRHYASYKVEYVERVLVELDPHARDAR